MPCTETITTCDFLIVPVSCSPIYSKKPVTCSSLSQKCCTESRDDCAICYSKNNNKRRNCTWATHYYVVPPDIFLFQVYLSTACHPHRVLLLQHVFGKLNIWQDYNQDCSEIWCVSDPYPSLVHVPDVYECSLLCFLHFCSYIFDWHAWFIFSLGSSSRFNREEHKDEEEEGEEEID